MKVKNMLLGALTAGLVLGCASMKVNVDVQHTPTMNTIGIQKIAVMPFTTSSGDRLQGEIASDITTRATAAIHETGRFTMLDPNEVKRLQDRKENIENYVDALFTGQIVTLNIKEGSHQEERYNSKTKTSYTVTIYDREVELAFSYNFARARDGSLIGVVTKMGKISDHKENSGSMRSPADMAMAIVTNRLRELPRDVAPYVAKEARKLMEEKSKNKSTQTSMKDAFALVKEGSYKAALNQYLKIYQDTLSSAAAYNSSIMYEALGDPNSARDILQELVDNTGNPAFRDALARMDKVLADIAAVRGEYADDRSQVDKVIVAAFSLIQKNLPRNARVALMKDAQTEASLTNMVIDRITTELQTAKITLVDRNNARLRAAEMEYQMTGNVRDEDFVGIGNEAGVNTFILVSISGTSSMRRLTVRLMDVGTGKIIYQLPATDEFNI
ncbi:hypothetical protein AGMMS49928_19690 [Spirochaetia bacterium]|nr:hypothetical protein AGMMS49928_19690 [Spirochaetia bacterium]